MPQLGLDPGGLDLRQGLQPTERLRGPDPLVGLGVHDADLGELVPQTEVVVVHPHAVTRLLVELATGPEQLSNDDMDTVRARIEEFAAQSAGQPARRTGVSRLAP